MTPAAWRLLRPPRRRAPRPRSVGRRRACRGPRRSPTTPEGTLSPSTIGGAGTVRHTIRRGGEQAGGPADRAHVLVPGSPHVGRSLGDQSHRAIEEHGAAGRLEPPVGPQDLAGQRSVRMRRDQRRPPPPGRHAGAARAVRRRPRCRVGDGGRVPSRREGRSARSAPAESARPASAARHRAVVGRRSTTPRPRQPPRLKTARGDRSSGPRSRRARHHGDDAGHGDATSLDDVARRARPPRRPRCRRCTGGARPPAARTSPGPGARWPGSARTSRAPTGRSSIRP